MTNGMNLWGRDFSLPVYYECDSDQDVLEIQKEAKDALLASWDTVEDSKEAIEDYCLERDGDQIESPITNIFRYVIPTSIVALRSDDARKAALMCNYRFDPEHGLAAVFENEQLTAVIPQDELLGRSYADRKTKTEAAPAHTGAASASFTYAQRGS